MAFSVDKVRRDFPALDQKVYDAPLIYFDNAATTLKPAAVIHSVSNYYSTINSNVHRGVHYLSGEATAAFEKARETVQGFLNARSSHEVIFTKGATEAINLVAHGFAESFLKSGDEIVVSGLEHHANLVPWQKACKAAGAVLKIVPFDEMCDIQASAFDAFLNENTRLVALTHVSNALGTVLPVKEIIRRAHDRDIPVLIDGAQGVVHASVDVQEMDCDFYCFSGHKIYGPMGIGILYGKEKYLERMEPYQTGGEMIKTVTYQNAIYNELPYKFEAGTPNVGGAIGLATAIDYVNKLPFTSAVEYENELTQYAVETLGNIKGLSIIGEPVSRSPVISFLLAGIHPYDAGTVIDRFGIAVRTGNHCAQPIMDTLRIPGTVRASFSFYNTRQEVDRLAEAIQKVMEMFS